MDILKIDQVTHDILPADTPLLTANLQTDFDPFLFIRFDSIHSFKLVGNRWRDSLYCFCI